MTSLQEARLSMYFAFKDFQAPYTSITNPLPNYTNNSTVFVNTITQIQNIAEQQKMSKKGITNIKKQAKETLIIMASDYARKLSVFAKFTNNQTLAQEVNFTESKLRQIADTAVKDYAQIVYDRAQTNVSALATYSITAATQTLLLNAITTYNNSIGKPRASRVESVKTTKQLDTLFKIADTILQDMDAAVEIVRLTQAEFYDSYKKARKVIDTRRRPLDVKCIVVDAVTGEGLKDVNVSFVLENNENISKSNKPVVNVVVKKTAAKGGFYIKSIAAGIYTVIVQKIGYANQKINVAIPDSELTELRFKLEKI